MFGLATKDFVLNALQKDAVSVWVELNYLREQNAIMRKRFAALLIHLDLKMVEVPAAEKSYTFEKVVKNGE